MQRESDLDHISSLERALCSDFSCCNLQLADLHALVEHVEEQHIDGIRIHSDPIPSRPPPQNIPLVYTPFNLAAMLNYIEPEFNPDPYPIFMHDDDLSVDIPPSTPDKKSKTRISKRKERTYRCPTPGCTKSYLNSNGLKYHLEKGTCRFEATTDSDTRTSPPPQLTKTFSPRRRPGVKPTSSTTPSVSQES